MKWDLRSLRSSEALWNNTSLSDEILDVVLYITVFKFENNQEALAPKWVAVEMAV